MAFLNLIKEGTVILCRTNYFKEIEGILFTKEIGSMSIQNSKHIRCYVNNVSTQDDQQTLTLCTFLGAVWLLKIIIITDNSYNNEIAHVIARFLLKRGNLTFGNHLWDVPTVDLILLSIPKLLYQNCGTILSVSCYPALPFLGKSWPNFESEFLCSEFSKFADLFIQG